MKLCEEMDIGVFIISPYDKGGALYKPTKKVVELVGEKLSPMQFQVSATLHRTAMHYSTLLYTTPHYSTLLHTTLAGCAHAQCPCPVPSTQCLSAIFTTRDASHPP